MIIEVLNLEDMQAAEIKPEEALFGEGLGLDSIDALELSLAIAQRYGLQIKADDAENQKIFASLSSLSAFIEKNRTTGA
ncbi:MAG: phosphopantetheine-binding protein [Xanthomonadales bacterium]|nr:phosphopantetheine-binding protein [Xanthomonadales bacterium]